MKKIQTQKWASKSRKRIVVFGRSMILGPPISLVDVKAPFSILETQMAFLSLGFLAKFLRVTLI